MATKVTKKNKGHEEQQKLWELLSHARTQRITEIAATESG
jgi:hypothetical protein